MKANILKVALVGAAAAALTACGEATQQSYEPEMVEVEGGTFTMGCPENEDDDCDKRERPLHSVTLSSFLIGKYEVTQKQWIAVMGGWPGTGPDSTFGAGDSYPAYNVSWDDVQRFIDTLNKKTGKRYRLPTEAEWEYAARGGAAGDNLDADIDSVAWYYDNSHYSTHAVGAKAANALGLHDMLGNVWEWCSDWYGLYSSDAQTNPRGYESGTHRIIRGGGWTDVHARCHVAIRGGSLPHERDSNLGLRLVLSLD
ncbi:MAG: formylglycine-generating enzyme family protein [Prevotellaceae bacterium]|jgi:formylglycine-generating enzyme required for sulfatase activity|nr:formylglycine-generating enzyme family protein [Prevotellaceae bacterium]